MVLLTAGADGATVFTADAATPIPPVAVEVVDTIGAGDAFSAGFFAHGSDVGGVSVLGPRRNSPRVRCSCRPAAEAATFAARVAALACSVQGATPPMSLGAEFRLTW